MLIYADIDSKTHNSLIGFFTDTVNPLYTFYTNKISDKLSSKLFDMYLDIRFIDDDHIFSKRNVKLKTNMIKKFL